MRFLSGVRAFVAALSILLTGLAAGIAQAGPGDPVNYRVMVHPAGQPPLSVYVEEMGRGPPILFLHGLAGSSYTWRFVAAGLAATHRVIAIDLRGFGRTEKPFDQAYSPADHAAVVRAFITERRLANLTLVGHSFGGMVTLMLALDARLEPHRISRLVLLNAPAYPQPFSPMIQLLQQPVLPYVMLHIVPPELPTILSFAMEKMGLARVHQRDIDIYADPLHEPGGPHALIQTARHIVPADFSRMIAHYPTIAKPTLVMTCREDQVVPATSAVRLSRAIPRARLAVLEGCDHILPEQAPQAVIAEMKRFLGR